MTCSETIPSIAIYLRDLDRFAGLHLRSAVISIQYIKTWWKGGGGISPFFSHNFIHKILFGLGLGHSNNDCNFLFFYFCIYYVPLTIWSKIYLTFDRMHHSASLQLICRIISNWQLLSPLVLSYLILSYLILSYLILSYLILSYLIYLILSYLILSYLIFFLSYLILSILFS